MGQTITKKDLEVFRGTYLECMAETTVNMKVYLAWDTQEIFIGNKNGAKIKYGGTKKLSAELATYFTAFKEEIYSSVDEYASNEVSTQVTAAIARFEAENAQTISDLKAEIAADLNTQNTSVDTKLANQKLSFDAQLGTINTTVSGIQTDISSLKNADLTLNSSISAIGTRIDSLKHLSYVSGDTIMNEVASLTASNTLSSFTPKFCTSTSSDNMFGAGILYYYNSSSGSIVGATSGSGGSSSKETKDAVLQISLVNDYTGGINVAYSSEAIYTEISSTNFSYNVKFSVTNSEYVSDLKMTKKVTIGTEAQADIVYEYDNNNTTTTPFEDNITSARTTVFTLSGTPKKEDISYIFTAEPKSVSIYAYQPILFGNSDSVLSHYRTFGNMSVSGLTANENVYIYSPTEISTITSSGFSVPFSLQSSSKISISFDVNGVSGCQYYVYSLGAINDTSMSILVA